MEKGLIDYVFITSFLSLSENVETTYCIFILNNIAYFAFVNSLFRKITGYKI